MNMMNIRAFDPMSHILAPEDTAFEHCRVLAFSSLYNIGFQQTRLCCLVFLLLHAVAKGDSALQVGMHYRLWR